MASKRLNPQFYKMARDNDVRGICDLARKKYHVNLNPALEPQVLIRQLQQRKHSIESQREQDNERMAMQGNAAEAARHDEPEQADGEPQAEQAPPRAETQPVEQNEAERRRQEMADKDYRIGSGRVASQVDESHPVLTAEQYEAEKRMKRRPDDYNEGARDRPNLPNVPEGLQQGPVHDPRTDFRHPQHTKWLFNPLNGQYAKPTELLMRNRNLQPIFEDPPAGARFVTM